MTRRIYLDHNASTPLLDDARDAMTVACGLAAGRGNPSSPHRFGHEARLSLESSRRDVAALVHAEPREIVFVSGGTEADNLAIQGAARAWTAAGRAPGRLVTSAVEHPAVLEACRYLESVGWTLTVLDVDGRGVVSPEDLRSALRADTALVSIMAANNETGVLQPIADLALVAREAGVPLHVDAVQAAGRIPVDVSTLGADFVSISAHKLGGPIGIGALWVREGAPMRPLMPGGGQERRRRAGTESPILAAAFAAAARTARASLGHRTTAELRDRMERELRARVTGLRVNGAEAPRLPNTSSLTIPGIDNEMLVIRMDLAGFALSTGAACSTGSTRPSHVLAAMGLPAVDIASTLRISLGPSNTRAEIDDLVETLPVVVAELARAGEGSTTGGPR